MLIHFLITLVDMNKFSGLSTYIAHYLGFHINHYYLFFLLAIKKFYFNNYLKNSKLSLMNVIKLENQ